MENVDNDKTVPEPVKKKLHWPPGLKNRRVRRGGKSPTHSPRRFQHLLESIGLLPTPPSLSPSPPTSRNRHGRRALLPIPQKRTNALLPTPRGRSNDILPPPPEGRRTNRDALDRLTPYQGDDRGLGHFRCGRCKRQWYSGQSWANKGQQCKKCNTMVYPHKQEKFQTGKGSGTDLDRRPDKIHDQSRCQKCQELQRNCQSLLNLKPSRGGRGGNFDRRGRGVTNTNRGRFSKDQDIKPGSDSRDVEIYSFKPMRCSSPSLD